jgi:hypothetical protein
VAGYYSATQRHRAAAPLAQFCTAAYILELNGDSYRLKQSKNRRRRGRDSANDEPPSAEAVDPVAGEPSS